MARHVKCCRNVPNAFPWPYSLHQLIKHGRLHPEVVEEELWVFYAELLH